MHEQGPNEHSEHEDEETNPERGAQAPARASTSPASSTTTRDGCTALGSTPLRTQRSWKAPSKEMLGGLTLPGAEEWAIHDYEGFGPLHLHEYEDFETVARVAAGIVEHGRSVCRLCRRSSISTADRLNGFEDSYMGEWESGAAFAEEMLDDMGLLEHDHESSSRRTFSPYVKIDYEALLRRPRLRRARSLLLRSRGGGIHVFRIC